MIPGIGISTFVPKIRNYADIGLVYKRTSLGNLNPAQSNSYFTMGAYNLGNVILFFFESTVDSNFISSAHYTKLVTISGNGTVLSVYYRVVDGTSNAFYFGSTTTHYTYYYCVYSNVDTTNPINVNATSKQDALTTSLNAPTVTTTRNKCLVINATGVRFRHFMGNGASAWANSYLSSFVEFCDYGGEVGAVVIATGFKVTAGNTGLTTFTYGTSTTETSITLALNPKEI